jgi:hypothetical protein
MQWMSTLATVFIFYWLKCQYYFSKHVWYFSITYWDWRWGMYYVLVKFISGNWTLVIYRNISPEMCVSCFQSDPMEGVGFGGARCQVVVISSCGGAWVWVVCLIFWDLLWGSPAGEAETDTWGRSGLELRGCVPSQLTTQTSAYPDSLMSGHSLWYLKSYQPLIFYHQE